MTAAAGRTDGRPRLAVCPQGGGHAVVALLPNLDRRATFL